MLARFHVNLTNYLKVFLIDGTTYRNKSNVFLTSRLIDDVQNENVLENYKRFNI